MLLKSLHILRLGLPALIWIALLVLLSGDMGSQSYTVRAITAVTNRWMPRLVPGFEVSQGRVHQCLLTLRKPAHVLMYGGLAVLSYRFLRAATALRRGWCCVLVLAWCAVVALLDETRQFFSAKRSASLVDMGLDVFAAGLALYIVRLRENVAQMRNG